jgi:4-amino-4-deoxy-L-arabinose transferase-like glycosyltransferase
VQRFSLVSIIVVLLLAAALRIVGLSWLPSGLSDPEITDITIAWAMRQGEVASFYRVSDTDGGREGLYPLALAVTSGILGTGSLNLRILSVWCGLLSVALIFALGRRLFGIFAGFIAAVAMAVTFWPVLLSRLAMHETLLLPLACAALLALCHALNLRQLLEPDKPNTRAYMTLGVSVAALAYTHWTGLIMMPFAVCFVAFLILTQQPITRRVLGAGGFSFVIAVILGIPYLTFTLRAFHLSGFYSLWATRPENINGLFNSVINTLLAVVIRGDPSVAHNLASEPLLGLLALALFVMGLIVTIDQRRAPNMTFILMSLVFGLLPSMWSRTAPDFGNMVMAIPAVMLLVGLGGQWIAQALFQKPVPMRSAQVMLITALIVGVSAYITMQGLFERWPNQRGVMRAYRSTLGYLASWLDRNEDDITTSICTFNLEDSPHSISDPTLLRLMMHRDATNLRFGDCLTGMVLTRGGELQRIAFADPDGAAAVSPVLKDWLHEAQDIPVPGLPPASVVQINVQEQLASVVGQVTLANATWSPEAAGTSEAAELPVRMGYNLTFEGYQIVPSRQFRAGDIVTLITYWRVDGKQEPDLQFFAHLSSNPFTNPLQQNDILRVEASTLQDRDIVIQVISFAPLPPNFPEGEYLISIGAYRKDTGERFPVYDQDIARGNRLFLDSIQVQR